MALSKKQMEVHVASVNRHKGPILLPDGMSETEAIEVLTRKKEYDNEKVAIREKIPVFVWDGAIALEKALEKMFGVALQESQKSWFGDIPPSQIAVEVGPGVTRQVPWGQFKIPGVEGWIKTGYTMDDERRIIFEVVCETTHKYEETIRELIRLTRKIAREESIYRGKAISIRFRDEDKDNLDIPAIKFPELTKAPVIFSKHIMESIKTNILTPIMYSSICRDAKIPLKRGALLAGPYGTGKTLTAGLVANVAVAYGWTFIYCPDIEELAEALKFAQGYQPCVVFGEDIDRMAKSERTDEVNALLNTLDGIGSKKDEIITIMTSNHAEQINAAMRRPGRIDIVMSIDPPNKDAAIQLVRHYGAQLISPLEDLRDVGDMMEGQIPAVIREVVERAKLEAIKRSEGQLGEIEAADLMAAGAMTLAEKELFAPVKKKNTHEMVVDAFGKYLIGLFKEAERKMLVVDNKPDREPEDVTEVQ